MEFNEKTPTEGKSVRALGSSNLGGADKHNYTQNRDSWKVQDNQRLSTDLADFLMFYRDRYGLNETLVKAVNLAKRSSECLAFGGGDSND